MDPNTTPAIPPPAGEVTNFINPPSMAWTTTLIMAIYVVVVTPFVAARIWTRGLIQKSLWWDDASQIISLIGLYGLAGMAIALNNYGSGRDLWNVTLAQYAVFTKLFGDFEIVARVSILFTKLSILQMYLRYFCPARANRNWTWWATHAVIIFNILYSIALVLVVLLQCVGKHPSRGQSCINENMVLVGASVINIITDLMVFVIPLAAVSRMQMARKTKIGVLVVFAVGGLSIVASVARLAYQIPQGDNKNRTVVTAIVIILAVAEQAVGQVAGCMPVLPALWRHLRQDPNASNTGYTYGSNDNGSRGQSQSQRGGKTSAAPYRAAITKADIQLAECGYSRHSEGSSRAADDEWRSGFAQADHDRLYVPIISAPILNPPPLSKKSSSRGANTYYAPRGRDGQLAPRAGEIGVSRTIKVDIR